jgi:dihydrodipicolinate synthase/N-acetylneuraminate lyase
LIQMGYSNENQYFSDLLEIIGTTNPQVIMIQDWDHGGYGLPDSLIFKLYEEVEAFRCLKVESAYAGVKYSRMIALTRGNLHVSGGWMVTQMIEGLERGVHSFMPTGMHYIYTEIFNQYIQGNRAEAQRIFDRILPVLSFSNQHLLCSIQFFKRLMVAKGIYASASVRNELIPFDDIQEKVAHRHIETINQLENEIKMNREQEGKYKDKIVQKVARNL